MKKYKVFIIGGGITGAACLYYLVKNGEKDILLVERDYYSSGSTGRCGGGIRQQWTTEANVKLAMRSVKHFEKFEKEMDFNFDYKQKGYLLLAFTEKEVNDFKKNIEMQKKLGLGVDLITPKEAKEIVPHLNIKDVIAASFCPTDGLGNPFLATYGYIERSKALGAETMHFTEVKKIKKEGKNYKVSTNNGDFFAEYIINAAGPQARDIALMIGYDIPSYPERHQILVTEPLEQVQGPMVIDFYHGIYCSQEKKGGFVMGESDPAEPVSYKTSSHWKFLESISKKFTYLFPKFKDLKILRQWAGSYTVSPDAQPILGPISAKDPKFFLSCGYSGHGFMLAPAVGEAIAEWVIHGKPRSVDISHLTMERIAKGLINQEHNVV